MTVTVLVTVAVGPAEVVCPPPLPQVLEEVGAGAELDCPPPLPQVLEEVGVAAEVVGPWPEEVGHGVEVGA